tara:strand:- start:2472 stop:2642 length:171 start_codon:yes stop_codon:yes gene_type:complete
MLRWFVAATPLAGAITFPLVVSIVIARIGLASGVIAALLLTVIWFALMLRTSEMPH